MTTTPQPVLHEGPCDGTGWVVTNPDWPNGTGTFRLRCSGCGSCDETDQDDAWANAADEARKGR